MTKLRLGDIFMKFSENINYFPMNKCIDTTSYNNNNKTIRYIYIQLVAVIIIHSMILFSTHM